MSDQPSDRSHRQLPDQPAASGRRKRSPAALIVVGTLTVAVGISAGLVAAGGHSTRASLSSEVKAPTKTLVTPSSAAAAAATATATRSSAAASTATRSAAAASAPTSAPWSSTSCPSQLVSWRSTGASGQLQVVVTDLTIVSQAATSLNADLASGTAPAADVTALRAATTSLNSGAQAARKNLIPGCVSAAYRAEVAGLTDLGGAVAGFNNAIGATGTSAYATAQRGLRTAAASIQSGSAEMATAITGLNRYGTR
jgi:trimeric autotransporter adhesin